MQSLTLDGLRSFEAAVRLHSFTAAAEEMCLSQSAISKQIKVMEEVLGKPLFIRGNRVLTLTHEGRVLHDGVQGALRQLASALEGVLPSQRSHVAITAPPAFASLWLAPRLARYRSEAPEIDIRLDASEAQLKLARDGFDLAIRLAQVHTAANDWVALTRERLVLVASPDMARRVHSAHDLPDCPLLSFDHPTGRLPGMGWPHWFTLLGLRMPAAQAMHRFSQYEHLLKAAQDGLGLAIGREPLVSGLIEEGRLQTVLPEHHLAGLGYYLVWSDKAASRPHVQHFAAWIQAELSASAWHAIKPAS